MQTTPHSHFMHDYGHSFPCANTIIIYIVSQSKPFFSVYQDVSLPRTTLHMGIQGVCMSLNSEEPHLPERAFVPPIQEIFGHPRGW